MVDGGFSIEELLGAAREEAAWRGARVVESGHLLLALLAVAPRAAGRLLRACDVDAARVAGLAGAVLPLRAGPAAAEPAPLAPGAARALELAGAEARAMLRERPTAADILLGLLRERDGVAAHVLAVAGVELERARIAARHTARETTAAPLAPATFRAWTARLRLPGWMRRGARSAR
jgi:ATP-dependent Clp protease ATP-binding subunit ClpA